jgi:hypothetical protein
MDPTRLRVGVLTPHAAVGPEAELPDMASGRVIAVVARVRPPRIAADAVRTPPTAASALCALTRGPAIDRAAASIRNESVDAVAFASTESMMGRLHPFVPPDVQQRSTTAKVEVAGVVLQGVGFAVVGSKVLRLRLPEPARRTPFLKR